MIIGVVVEPVKESRTSFASIMNKNNGYWNIRIKEIKELLKFGVNDFNRE